MLGGKCECLPIPSNVPRISNPELARAVRLKYKASEYLVGHFGTYGDHIKPLLKTVIQSIYASSPSVSFLLLGRGAEAFAKVMKESLPATASLSAIGDLIPSELSAHLSACDVMIQPFLDGVTTRRTTVMASLAHGLPIVTTSGHLTEDFWAHKGALELGPSGRPDIFAALVSKLLRDESARSSLSQKALQTYNDCFSIEQHMRKLLNSTA
jgi:glycosyltransferase involved in cell wall biosynthesis